MARLTSDMRAHARLSSASLVARTDSRTACWERVSLRLETRPLVAISTFSEAIAIILAPFRIVRQIGCTARMSWMTLMSPSPRNESGESILAYGSLAAVASSSKSRAARSSDCSPSERSVLDASDSKARTVLYRREKATGGATGVDRVDGGSQEAGG